MFANASICVEFHVKLPFSINMNVRLVFRQLHAEMYACENRASMRYRYTCKQGVYIVHGDNETMHNHAAYIRYVNACKLCFNTLTSMVEMQCPEPFLLTTNVRKKRNRDVSSL